MLFSSIILSEVLFYTCKGLLTCHEGGDSFICAPWVNQDTASWLTSSTKEQNESGVTV